MTDTSPSIWIVIPAYNEARVIASVLREVQAAGYRNIVVVDDGSKDRTADEAASVTGTEVLVHRLNRGKGAATKTGVEAAKLLGADIVVTLDGDGQHDPADIGRLIQPILAGQAAVVLGTRLRDPRGMPWYKVLANSIANFFTWYIYGLWVSDSQSGFRAYRRSALERIDTVTDRYEYDSEVIRQIYLHRLRFREVPVTVRYTEYSMGKVQKQGFWNGLKTLYKIVFNLFH